MSGHTYPCKQFFFSGAIYQIHSEANRGILHKAKLCRPLLLSSIGRAGSTFHSPSATASLTALQKPGGLLSVMDTSLSSQTMPMTPMKTAHRNKRSRSAGAAAAAPEPTPQVCLLHGVGVKLEGQHISNGASQPHEVVVETAGLATALELTGSAEPEKKQARRKPGTTAVEGLATPALEHAPSQAATETKRLIEERKAVMAAVAAAMRGAGAKPKRGSMQQESHPDAVTTEGMPAIPLAERVKSRARRTKTAPSALEDLVKTEDGGQLDIGTTPEAQSKLARRRAAKKVEPEAAAELDAVQATVEAEGPAKKARAPRKKPPAVAEVPLHPLLSSPCVLPVVVRSFPNLHACMRPPARHPTARCSCWQTLS